MTGSIHGSFAGHESSADQSPWLDLTAAIVKQAAEDYMAVLCKIWKTAEKKDAADVKAKRKLIVEKMELEEFFHSEWYEFLTDIDPDRLIFQCRVKAKEKMKKEIAQANKRKIKKLLKDV